MAALVAAGLVTAFTLLGGDEPYKVKARFQNAAQLVKGNLVQISGRRSARSQAIELTDDGQAEVELEIDDDYAPLRRGTQATVRAVLAVGHRQPLRRPPARRRQSDRRRSQTAGRSTQTDDDHGGRPRPAVQPRSTPSTRAGAVATSSAASGDRTSAAASRPTPGCVYLNPSLAASSRLFRELNHDKPSCSSASSSSPSKLVTDIAERRDDLAGLVDQPRRRRRRRDRRRAASRWPSAIAQLPDFMRRANTTFVNLRATLDDLDPLVEESKPVAKKLRPVPRRAAPVRPRRPADAPRPRRAHPRSRQGQRPDRADQRQVAGPRHRGRRR